MNQSFRRAGAIIVDKTTNKVLLMHRIKNNHEYYCFPGGHPEEGETPQQAAQREIEEETTLKVQLIKKPYIVNEKRNEEKGYYFYTTEFSGTAILSGPEKNFSCATNQFTLVWFEIDKLHTITLYPEELVKTVFC